ncbi:hypothetical protein [Embleya sp. NPDC005575]|uniref:HoxN/HupN/NixA family nickel/cobalt transporter n=1 Tax=Embleya sp. NPDC005575 TaxID=3156892 RepID=UPI00339EED93
MKPLTAARSRAFRLLLMGVLAAAVSVLGVAGVAEAHPFGTPPVVRVTAEGATVNVIWSAAADDLTVLGEAAKAEAASEAQYLGAHVKVIQNGVACRLDEANTLRLADDGARLRYGCPEPVNTVALSITALSNVDSRYRTISVTPTGAGGLHTASEPTRTLALGPSGAGHSADAGGPKGPFSVWTTDLTALLDHRVALPLALLVAALVGAFHACAPGHGKTLAAGFLIGGRGRAPHALWLGLIVAAMHTVSVAALAVGWWLAAESAPDVAALTGWLQLIAALVVVAVGVGLLRRQRSIRAHGHSHDHGHDHDHDHDHGHGHGHGHSHVAPTESLLTRRGLVLLGTSGGLLPSPSAFLVLLTGLLTGRFGIALLMVAAFGLGMALTLAGVGLAVLRGRDVLLAQASKSANLRAWTHRLPIAGASAVVVGGVLASAMAAGQVLAP